MNNHEINVREKEKKQHECSKLMKAKMCKSDVRPCVYNSGKRYNHKRCLFILIFNLFLVSELFARLTGVKNFWGRDKGVCRAWLAYTPYLYVTEASKVEVSIFIV